MAYASLNAEVRGDWSHLRGVLTAANNAMNTLAQNDRVIKVRMDDKVFTQVINLRNLLATIGVTTANVDIKVNGVSLAVADLKQATTEVKETRANVELLQRGLKELGAGGAVRLKFDAKEMIEGANDAFEQLTAKSAQFRLQFAKGMGVDQILNQITGLQSKYANAGIDVSGITAAIPALRSELELINEIQARKHVDFTVTVGKDGVANLRDLKVTVDQTEKSVTAAAAKLEQVKQAGFADLAAFDRYKKGVDDATRFFEQKSRDRARAFQQEVNAAQTQADKLRAVLMGLRARGAVGDGEVNALNALQARMSNPAPAKAMPAIGDFQRFQTYIQGLAATLQEVDQKERALESDLERLSSKGYGAFAGMLRGLNDVDAAAAKAKAKLAEIAGPQSARANWSPSIGAYQKELDAARAAANNAADPIKKLDSLMIQIRERGGGAMEPFIRSANTLDDAILRATAHLQALKSVRVDNVSAGRWNPAISAKITGADDAAFAAIQRANVLNQAQMNELMGGLERGAGPQVAAGFERINKLIQNTGVSIDRVNREISQFEGTVNRLGREGAAPGTAIAQGMRDAAEKVQRTDQQTGSLVTSLKQVYNTIVRWAIGYLVVSQLIGGIRALQDAIIDYNALLEKSEIAFATLMNGNEARARRFMATLREFAKVTPYEYKSLVPLTQRLVTLGVVAQNEVEKKAVPALTAIGNAVSALGGGDDLINRVVLALGQMTQKGKASSEEVTRQLAEAGINGAKYIADAMGKTIPEVFALMKKGAIDGKAAAQAVLYGLANDPKYKDMMAKFSQTFEGAMSNLKDWANDTVASAFKGVFDSLRDRLVAFVKLTESTKFRLDLADQIDRIKYDFDVLRGSVAKVIELVQRFNALLPLTFLLISQVGKANPYILLAVTIARVIVYVNNLLSAWDQMSVAMKALNVVMGVFVLLLATIQIEAFINSIMAAAGGQSLLARAIAAVNIQLITQNLLLARQNFVQYIANIRTATAALGGRAGLSVALGGNISLISSLALYSLPLLVAAAGLAAAAWQNYKARGNEADVLNNNLAISIDGVKEALGRLKSALSNSSDGSEMVEALAERFEKAKNNAGSLAAFLGKISSQGFADDLKLKYKLDPTSLYVAMKARDDMIKRANAQLQTLKIKAEVLNDPYGWELLKKNFEDAMHNEDNWFYWLTNKWDQLANTVNTWADNTARTLARWSERTFGPIGQVVGDLIRRFQGLEDAGTDAAARAAGNAAAAASGGGLPASRDPYGDPGAASVPDAANAAQVAALKAKMGAWYQTVANVERMNLDQLRALRAKWNKAATNDPGFFDRFGLDQVVAAATKRIDKLKNEIQQPKASDLLLNGGGDDKKAENARKKLENDRLQDAAALADAMAARVKKSYEDQAKAAEDSAKRQIDALKSINDKVSDLVGGFQDALAKYGVLNSPLDAVINRLEKLMNIGPRMAAIASGAVQNVRDLNAQSSALQKTYADHSLHARMSLDKNNGGDGMEPAREYKRDLLGKGDGARSSVVPSWLANMEADSGRTFGRNCAIELTAQLRKVGVSIGAISGASMSPRWRVGLNENGMLPAGTLIRWRPGMGGFRDGHYAAIGSDQEHFTESNMRRNGHGKNYISTDREINWDKLRAQVQSGVALAFAPPGGVRGTRVTGSARSNRFIAAMGRGAGVSGVVGAEENNGEDLLQAVEAAMQNLRLSKLSPIPKEFGQTIKDAEGHAGRFKVQMMLADTATQSLLRARLGENGFRSLARDLGVLADTFDKTETRLRAGTEINKLLERAQTRKYQNDPLGAMRYRERPGGDLEFLKPDGALRRQANALRDNPFVAAPGAASRLDAQFKADGAQERKMIDAIRNDVIGDAVEKLRAYNRADADRRKSMALSREFIKDATVDTYGLTRAQDLLNKKMDFARSDQMAKLFNTDRAKFNDLLSQFERTSSRAYDLEKGEARRVDMETQRRDLDRRMGQLRAQLPLIRDTTLSENALSEALDRQAQYFQELYRLRDLGHTDQRSRELAAEFSRPTRRREGR